MGFYGNIIKHINDAFFSAVTFKNKDDTEIPVKAKYLEDGFTLSSGNRWLQFKKETNEQGEEVENSVIIEHSIPDETNSKPIIIDSTKENVDISANKEGASFFITSKNYDSLGHINGENTKLTFDFNIKTEINARETGDIKLNERIANEENRSALIDKDLTEKLNTLINMDNDKSVRTIATEEAEKTVAAANVQIENNKQNIDTAINNAKSETELYTNEQIAQKITDGKLSDKITFTHNFPTEDKKVLQLIFQDKKPEGVI